MSISALKATAAKLYDKATAKTETPKTDPQPSLETDKVSIKTAAKSALAGLGVGAVASLPLTAAAAFAGGRILSLPGMLLTVSAGRAAPLAGVLGAWAATRSDTLAGSAAYGAAAGAATGAAAAAVTLRGNPSLALKLAPVYIGAGAIAGVLAGTAEHAVNRK